MAIGRKRKHDAASEQRPDGFNQDITKFARVGKAHSVHVGLKKLKVGHQEQIVKCSPTKASFTPQSVSKAKRKREASLEPVPYNGDTNSTQSAQNSALITTPMTPTRKRSRIAPSSPPKDSPSKTAVRLFENLMLGSKRQSTTQHDYTTPPYTPNESADKELGTNLPSEVQDLGRLQSAFLGALSLYYAHHGSSSPVSVDTLLPMITTQWKERAVSLRDLRTILALMEHDEPEFELMRYDRAGICLTRKLARGRQATRIAGFVDEVELSHLFQETLTKRWIAWQGSEIQRNQAQATFLNQLPLVDISVPDSSLLGVSRGKARLESIRSSQAAATAAADATLGPKPEIAADASRSNRGGNLLDRILAKQAHNASLPAGPTKAHMERKASLQRVEEIARVLDLLAAGRSRCSYGMQAMVQQIQQSLRNPLGKEEVTRCLQLMATEVTPDFVKVLTSGGVNSVVVTRGGKVDLSVLRVRVHSALEAL